jgi:hypothetical protein
MVPVVWPSHSVWISLADPSKPTRGDFINSWIEASQEIMTKPNCGLFTWQPFRYNDPNSLQYAAGHWA